MNFFRKKKYTKARVTILSGKFSVNMDEDIAKLQDPYVWFKIEGTQYQTTTKQNAGFDATWNESFDVNILDNTEF